MNSEAQERHEAISDLVRVKGLIDEDDRRAGFPNKQAIRILLAGIHYFEKGNYTAAIFQAVAAEGKLRKGRS